MLEIDHEGKIYLCEILYSDEEQIVLDILNYEMKSLTVRLNAAEFNLLSWKQVSLSTFDHTGAFVLPFTREFGKICFYLGRETKGTAKGLYDSFGGHRDEEDGPDPIVTAGRELWEEGLFSQVFHLTCNQTIENVFRNTKEILALYDNEANCRDVIYLTEFRPEQMRTFLERYPTAARKTGTVGDKLEKDNIAKVTEVHLREALEREADNRKVICEAEVVDLDGEMYIEEITLRPIFAKLMRGLFGIYRYGTTTDGIKFSAT